MEVDPDNVDQNSKKVIEMISQGRKGRQVTETTDEA